MGKSFISLESSHFELSGGLCCKYFPFSQMLQLKNTLSEAFYPNVTISNLHLSKALINTFECIADFHEWIQKKIFKKTIALLQHASDTYY